MTRRIYKRVSGLVCFFIAIALAIPVWAAPSDVMTRDEIMDRAKLGVGYGYWWGRDRWRDDGLYQGHCELDPGKPSCPDCHYVGVDSAGGDVDCEDRNQDFCFGADCSGFVGKCWKLGAGQDPLSTYSHPYSTYNFRKEQTHWTRINRGQLLQGDALVYRNDEKGRGHIVLFDRLGTNGRYWVYHAAGCNKGIVYEQRKLGVEYIGIRRNDITEVPPQPPCTPDCSGNGNPSGDTCLCYSGYSGDQCDVCAEGFWGYPDCRREPGPVDCYPERTIGCGDSVQGSTKDGRQFIDTYEHCSNWNLEGMELVYEFRPGNFGSAVARLSDQDFDVDIMVLRGSCDRSACVEYGNNEAYFDFDLFESYYLVVDSASLGEGSFTLTLDCDYETSPWIGSPCQDDSDCVITLANGRTKNGSCYRKGGARFCSTDCTNHCPDRAGEAATYCVEDPASAGSGMCVSKAEDANNCCNDVIGASATRSERFGDTSSFAWVCLPAD